MKFLLLIALIVCAVEAQRSATVYLNFGAFWPNDGTFLLGTVEVDVCSAANTAYRQISDIPFTQNGDGEYIVALETPGLIGGGQTCSVNVQEGGIVVSRQFTMFSGQNYTWNDLTTPLDIHIETWNPYCALSPTDNQDSLIYNGGRVYLNAVLPQQPTSNNLFREYSNKPVICGSEQISFEYFPRLDNGNWFGENNLCDETGGAFTRQATVGVLKTTIPIQVYAEEFRNSFPTPNTRAQCDALAFTLGHNGITYLPNETGTIERTVDTNCADARCDSGLLIARLQIPNLCVEPVNQGASERKLGQIVDGTQFPATSLLLTHYLGTERRDEFQVRWYPGVANTRIEYYLIATNVYELSAQWPALTQPSTDRIDGSLIKANSAFCYEGKCEAQPITSTLYIDAQGHCEDIRDITINQQGFNVSSTTNFISNHVPDCSDIERDNGQLLYCVFNLPRTEITIEYNLYGTANTVDVALPTINCRTTVNSQRCESPGGLAELCPLWGCLEDPAASGPTQLNLAVTYNVTNTDFVLQYQIASPADLTSNRGGCLWVPALGELKVTLSEGCCQYPVSSGANIGGFTGCGCVQASSLTTTCEPGSSCVTDGSFGRTLTVFDVAYLPEEPGLSTTSVALETPKGDGSACCPFRFKTQQGGAPRCYCVLPIVLSARIIETNLDTRAQACKCTKNESCVVRYEDREEDCSICDFLSAFNFDLTGLPRWSDAQLFVGPGSSTSSTDMGMKLLRNYEDVGGVNNWKSVLRTGAQANSTCCEMETYCLRVIENAAELERCIKCDSKKCVPKGYTRDLCLNLASPCPNGTIDGLLDVALFTSSVSLDFDSSAPVRNGSPSPPAEWVRTVKRQGGVNGCQATATSTRSEPVQAEAEMYDPEELLSMTEEELLDYEATQAAREHLRENREAERSFLSSPNNGIYTVLAIPYEVYVFEKNARVQKSVNCTHPEVSSSDSSFPICNVSDVLNCMCLNTTCAGEAIGPTGINGGGIPDRITVTLGTQSTVTPFGQFERSLPQPSTSDWQQIRGPRGYWSQNLTTCSWSQATWINATFTNAGNQYQCVPVLATDNLAVRVEEGLIEPPANVWPDPRGHPTVTVEVDCTYPTTPIASGEWAGWTCRQKDLKPPCFCEVMPMQIFALWEIVSVRGAPAAGDQLVFKYTRPDQTTFSNQGVYRNVERNALDAGSGLEFSSADVNQWQPGYNFFCQVADPLYAFSFNWGQFAYPWSSGQLLPRPNAFITNFNCDANTIPQIKTATDEGLNLCRGCGLANVEGNSVQSAPCLYTDPEITAGRLCNTSALLAPAASYNLNGTIPSLSADSSVLCRLAWVYTGSDDPNRLPLGEILVLPYMPHWDHN